MKEHFEHLGARAITGREFFEHAIAAQQSRVDRLLAAINIGLIASDCSDYVAARDKLLQMQKEWVLHYANDDQATA